MLVPSEINQRRLSAAALLAGVAALILVAMWPDVISQVPHSRGEIALLALWFFVVAGFTDPGFRRGFVQGMREFRRHSGD